MASNTDSDDPENATEFVMKKDGNHIQMWAVVNGHEVFHAAPPVTSSSAAIRAAVKTWITRAWEREFNEMLEDDDPNDGWFR